ncbi:hypothetical protein AB6A40_006398 [Gnathostoma spinigerum]|uniref:Uncharacterized protein n=1 Tax=Gnathostoma spinigerum TaxID=75299 RepID=A0ABD6ENG8_9BILA
MSMCAVVRIVSVTLCVFSVAAVSRTSDRSDFRQFESDLFDTAKFLPIRRHREIHCLKYILVPRDRRRLALNAIFHRRTNAPLMEGELWHNFIFAHAAIRLRNLYNDVILLLYLPHSGGSLYCVDFDENECWVVKRTDVCTPIDCTVLKSSVKVIYLYFDDNDDCLTNQRTTKRVNITTTSEKMVDEMGREIKTVQTKSKADTTVATTRPITIRKTNARTSTALSTAKHTFSKSTKINDQSTIIDAISNMISESSNFRNSSIRRAPDVRQSTRSMPATVSPIRSVNQVRNISSASKARDISNGNIENNNIRASNRQTIGSSTGIGRSTRTAWSSTSSRSFGNLRSNSENFRSLMSNSDPFECKDRREYRQKKEQFELEYLADTEHSELVTLAVFVSLCILGVIFLMVVLLRLIGRDVDSESYILEEEAQIPIEIWNHEEEFLKEMTGVNDDWAEGHEDTL